MATEVGLPAAHLQLRISQATGGVVVTIIYWTVGWLVGIWLGSTLPLPVPLWILCGLLCFVAAILLRQQRIPLAVSIFMAALALGAARYNHARPILDQSHIAHFANRGEVVLTGIVSEAPDVRDRYQNLVVDVDMLAIEGSAERPVDGKVLVRARRFPLIEYGARVQIVGQLTEPHNYSEFDYRAYLAGRNIYATVDYPELIVQDQRVGNPLMHSLLDVHARAQETIERLLPQPQAALLSGILLGDEGRMTAELKEDFRKTGMTHIIAISGFNIAIIAGVLLQGGRYLLGNRGAAWVAIGGIALYTLFVGAEAAVVRAALMATLFVVAAKLLGRPTFVPAALFAAAFFMTFADPDSLWHVGFQLSFAATLGLMLYVGPWSDSFRTVWQQQFGEQTGNWLASFFAEVVLTTTAASIMTLPIVAFHFGTFSLVSPLANLLILPAQTGIMAFGGIATLAGMVSPILGQAPAWIAWLFLSYTIGLVRFFAALPLATLAVNFPAWAVAASYASILGLTWAARTRLDQSSTQASANLGRQARRWTPMMVTLASLLVIAWAWSRPDGRLHVAFLDVGQGDAILIRTPDGRQIAVDGGRYPSIFLDKLGQEIPFWDTEIDIMVATHPDDDHTLGLIDTFDHYRVGLLLVNGEETLGSDNYAALLHVATAAHTPIRQAVAGEVIDMGDGVRLEILHPGGALDPDTHNRNSVAVRLVYGDFAVLLTGDAEKAAEQMMLAGGRSLHSTVFKAGHHGSRSSSSRAFLQAVRPQIVVISAGKENTYDHPHPDVLQRAEEIGATVLRTDELGTIELISDGTMMWSNVKD